MANFENYLVRYFSVSYTGLKSARKDLKKEELEKLALEETAEYFGITEEEVIKELDNNSN